MDKLRDRFLGPILLIKKNQVGRLSSGVPDHSEFLAVQVKVRALRPPAFSSTIGSERVLTVTA